MVFFWEFHGKSLLGMILHVKNMDVSTDFTGKKKTTGFVFLHII